MQQRATIDDVARAAGVSVATVSRALRDLPYVAPATKQRVRAAATQLDYVADANASRLASGRTRTIGVIAPLITSWYTSEVIAGVEEVLNRHGYDLLIATAGSGSSLRTHALSRVSSFKQRVDALILVDVFCGETTAQNVRDSGTPTIAIGERLKALPSLAIDNEYGAELAVRHLLELGHRRIAVMGGHAEGDTASNVPEARLRGYHNALASAHVRPDKRLEFEGSFAIDGSRPTARRMLGQRERPTAVFCFSDEMAFGVLQVAREMGVDVPTQLSVVGFDDHPVAEAFGLTTVRQPVREMGGLAARSLMDMLDYGAPTPPHQAMGVRLVTRSSSAAPVF